MVGSKNEKHQIHAKKHKFHAEAEESNLPRPWRVRWIGPEPRSAARPRVDPLFPNLAPSIKQCFGPNILPFDWHSRSLPKFHTRFPRLAHASNNNMSTLHHRLGLLGRVLLALQACFLAAHANSVVEFDLIFPRNETYAPGPLLPVVFVTQNASMAASLNFTIVWEIHPLSNPTKFSAQGGVLLSKDQLTTGGEPFFTVTLAPGFNGTEEKWLLRWQVLFSNCSGSAPNTKATRNNETRYHYFSTKPGAQAPSLLQGPGTTCVNSTGVVLNVAEKLPFGSNDSCLALASPPIGAANPCAVTVDKAVSSLVLGKNCGADTATTCYSASDAAQSTPASGAAQGAPVLVAWLWPVLAGLVLYVAV